MSIEELDSAEKMVVFDCMRAAVEGPFFPDWEFHSLFGMERSTLGELLTKWPNLNDDNQVSLAINNSFANLLGYPHQQESAWKEFIKVSQQEVDRIFRKWRKLKGYA